jgi:hypothetical protein
MPNKDSHPNVEKRAIRRALWYSFQQNIHDSFRKTPILHFTVKLN